MEFNGKVALLTGGIGKAYCSALLKTGMKVCVCDINENSFQEYQSNLSEDQKSNVFYQECDVTSFDKFKDAFDKVIAKFGCIDLVVNNAGILNEHNWQKVVEVNFVGIIHGIKLAFQYMDITKGGFGGFVVNTASNAGFEAFELSPVYTGCKHGVVGLTKSYGTDYHFQRSGVKVCAVCPGPVDTPLFHEFPGNSLNVEVATRHNADVKPIQFAYSMVPVIVIDGARNWTALDEFSLEFFRDLYLAGQDDPYWEVEKECQFFPYKTEFVNLADALSMSPERERKPWYIGWSNCDSQIGNILRTHYSRPYFLPPLSESANIDWIFMGKPGHGAHMHIDHVNNPSWQAQIRGSKLWTLEPVPECYHECRTIEAIVQPGEVIVLDTNRWYHKTLITGDELSITIGSEYD